VKVPVSTVRSIDVPNLNLACGHEIVSQKSASPNITNKKLKVFQEN